MKQVVIVASFCTFYCNQSTPSNIPGMPGMYGVQLQAEPLAWERIEYKEGKILRRVAGESERHGTDLRVEKISDTEGKDNGICRTKYNAQGVEASVTCTLAHRDYSSVETHDDYGRYIGSALTSDVGEQNLWKVEYFQNSWVTYRYDNDKLSETAHYQSFPGGSKWTSSSTDPQRPALSIEERYDNGEGKHYYLASGAESGYSKEQYITFKKDYREIRVGHEYSNEYPEGAVTFQFAERDAQQRVIYRAYHRNPVNGFQLSSVKDFDTAAAMLANSELISENKTRYN